MRSLLFKLFGVLLLAGSFALGWFIMDFQAFRELPLNIRQQGETLVVAPGTTLKQLTGALHARGVLDQPGYFNLLGRYLGVDSKIRAGEFLVKADTTPEELLTLLTKGKVLQHSLTIVEGQSFRELLARIRETDSLTQTLAGLSGPEIMTELGHKDVHPEGRFLPETYYFPRGSSDRKFLGRAFDAMESYLNQAWSERNPDLPLESAYEALILASIVEKESGLAAERPRIAGVFIRRLKLGMRLQTDPTVIYGLGERFDGNIRYRDLRTDTPYNSYTRHGLPPTPIAMPGREAILAALHPAEGTELFFVSKGDGSHVFSTTIEGHNRAVRRYQLKKR